MLPSVTSGDAKTMIFSKRQCFFCKIKIYFLIFLFFFNELNLDILLESLENLYKYQSFVLKFGSAVSTITETSTAKFKTKITSLKIDSTYMNNDEFGKPIWTALELYFAFT